VDIKWNILMTVIGVLLVSGLLTDLDGGTCGNQGCILIPRNPFWDNPPGGYCSLTLTVLSPVDNTTYYGNNVDLIFTAPYADTCRYRVIGPYLWNNVPCNYNNTITWPEGWNEIEVQASNGLCSKSVYLGFEIIDYRGATVTARETDVLTLFIVCGIVLLLVGVDRRKRKGQGVGVEKKVGNNYPIQKQAHTTPENR